uniref:Uncharacterized protein n=1 Tax=Heterorhabditis bacteriophora TaxID=37862 RepID=A0A1I7WJI3_HETBA
MSKAIMNFLRRQEEYGTKKSSGRPSKLNDRKFCGLRRITRSASMKSVGHVPLMPQNLRCGELFQYCPMTTEEIIKTDTEACKRKTLLG